MPLGNVLTLAEFFSNLPIAQQTFWMPDQLEQNRTGSGEQITADLGDRLWQGDVLLGKMTRGEAGRHEVLIDLLNQAGRAFEIFDSRRPRPLLDPNATVLGASSVTILALGADARELRLTGLPAGYTLSSGDYLSFTYGTSPVRFALHRVVLPVTANGSGQTPLFEVSPAIQPGAVVAAAVTLNRPRMKAVIKAGSMEPGRTSSTITEGVKFSFIQTLRN
jgi:hypothetical protein